MIMLGGGWAKLMKAGFGMIETGFRFGEMMMAADSVVRHRSRTIDAAARDPLSADYAELARMVPEKVEAFARAGNAVAGEMWAMQREIGQQMHHIGALMVSGLPPTPAALSALGDRLADHGASMAVRTMGVGGVALAPIHARATANARRLRSRRRG